MYLNLLDNFQLRKAVLLQKPLVRAVYRAFERTYKIIRVITVRGSFILAIPNQNISVFIQSAAFDFL